MKSLGSRIREIRKSIGMTQAQLSEKSKIALSSIQRYEKNDRVPNMNRLKEIAKALGVLETDLLGLELSDNVREIHNQVSDVDSAITNLRECILNCAKAVSVASERDFSKSDADIIFLKTLDMLLASPQKTNK